LALGLSLSFVVVEKLIAQRRPEAGWRNSPFYLIPGLYGGVFITMLVFWRLV